MGSLKEDTSTLLSSFQEAKTELSLISFLVLEYHVSTESRIKGEDALYEFYGIIHEQLVEVYIELDFAGYIDTDQGTIKLKDKANKLLSKKVKRRNPVELKRIKDGFEVYWAHLSKKIGKKKALLVWMKLSPNEELMIKINKAIVSQNKYKSKMDSLGKFVPELQHPERWLSNERWEDTVEERSVIRKPTRPERDER